MRRSATETKQQRTELHADGLGTEHGAVPNGAYLGNGNGFTPGTLTVPAGTTVMWGNNDITAHTLDLGHRALELENMKSWRDVSGEARQPGARTGHHCTIHSFMTGTIVVQ